MATIERLSLTFIAVVAVLVILESPPVKAAFANAAANASDLRVLCGYGEATGHY